MAKDKPKNVLKLIADAQARQAAKQPKTPPVSANIHTTSSLWSRIRLRGKGGGGNG